MFENIGKKIKGLCKIVFYVLVFCSVIGGIVCFTSILVANKDPEFEQIFGGFLLMLLVSGLGVFISWILVLFLYAFGELVDTNQKQVSQNSKIISILLHTDFNNSEDEELNSSVKFFTNDGSKSLKENNIKENNGDL